jgi:hypothetical protein
MRVTRWDDTEFISPTRFSTVLPGALVEVTFSLKHYYIKKNNVETNSFSASVQEVVILKPAPPSVPSPFQNRKIAGALSVSQSPRKSPSKSGPTRGEQETAAASFGPPDVPMKDAQQAQSSNPGNGEQQSQIAPAAKLPVPARPIDDEQVATDSAGSSGAARKRKKPENEVAASTSKKTKEVGRLVQ